MLSKENHRVDIVGNGAEAVEAISTRPYDVVLMDVQMPEMDGIEATAAIRELPGELSKVPIIALTANAMKGDRERYLGAGMDDYVSKPIDRGELMAAIARVTGHESVPDGADGAPPNPSSQSQLSDEAMDALGSLSQSIENLGGELSQGKEKTSGEKAGGKRRSKRVTA